MSKRSKRRGYQITIGANGKQRQILSITEKSNAIGTITIGAMPALFFREGLESESSTVRDRKYSIHPNLQSPTTNTIHERVQRVDKIDLDHMSYTKALKVNDCFAPIFARGCADPRPKRYNLRLGGKGKTIVSLGEYNPDQTTLLYCLLLSPPGTSEIIDKSGRYFSVTSLPLPDCELTILSVAVSNFRSVHMGTIINFSVMEGIPADKIESFFRYTTARLVLLLREMHGSGMAVRFGEHVE